MLNKKQVIEAVEQMPDSFDATDLFDRILLLKKIQQAQQDIENGNSFTTEAAKEKLKEWLQ